MKINRPIRHDAVGCPIEPRKRGFFSTLAVAVIFGISWGAIGLANASGGDEAANRSSGDAQARQVLGQVVARLVRGEAFDAKLQQTVWAAEREVVGVGTYLQAGENTGRYRMQMKLHTGRDTHHFNQISDGRLAWIRTEIEGSVSLSRVDVSRLNQWIQPSDASYQLSPGYLAGGLVEMLDTIARDFDLTVQPAKLDGQQMIVIAGTLRADVRQRTANSSGVAELASLQPTMVRVVVQTQDDLETQIGKGLPVRWEYWSDPVAGEDGPESEHLSTKESKHLSTKESNGDRSIDGPSEESSEEPSEEPIARDVTSVTSRRMISLLHLRSIRRIPKPNEVEFRYENRDVNVDFINETDRYLQRHGMQLTESQRVQLRR